jgi:ribosome-binding factor A
MSARKDRLGDEIRDLLANCFAGDRLNDPRIQGVTVTHVKLTGDLQLASVYFRVYESERKDEVLKGLESCKGFLRKHLASGLDIRRVPELRFFYDESVEYGSRIEFLIEQGKGS